MSLINEHLKNYDAEKRLIKQRLFILTIVVLLLLLIIILRLVSLQIFQHPKYATLSKRNQISTIAQPPIRGKLLDRHGKVVAENRINHQLALRTDKAERLKQSLKNLRQFIELSDSDDDIISAVRKSRFAPVVVENYVNMDTLSKLMVHRYLFPQVEFITHFQRHYPYGAALGHITGYMGYISDQDKASLDQTNYLNNDSLGKSGLEKSLEERLRGKMGYKHVETNSTGRYVRTLVDNPPEHGEDITLSIDADFQKFAHELMGEKRGAIVVMQAKTGEVLALVSTPGFDPNAFVDPSQSSKIASIYQKPYHPMFNRAIYGQYPLASIIKPFVAIKGLEEGVINVREKMRDLGYFHLPNNKHMYRDPSWAPHGHGWVDLTRSIVVSCDTYYYRLAYLLGIKNISEALTDFGYGRKTGIEFVNEAPGIVPTPDWKKKVKGARWYDGDTVITGIGQGYMLTTPIQMAQSTAILANKGVKVKPTMLKQTLSAESDSVSDAEFQPYVLKSEKNWDIIHHAMRKVMTSPEGTGRRFGQDVPYTVAAKTGTGQVFSMRNYKHLDARNLPDHLKDNSSTIAFAPYEDPEIVVAIILEHDIRSIKLARSLFDYYFQDRYPQIAAKMKT